MTQNKEKIDVSSMNDFLERNKKLEQEKTEKQKHSNKVLLYAFSNQVTFESLTKQKPRKIHHGRAFKKMSKLISSSLDSDDLSDTIRLILENTKKYMDLKVFDLQDARRYLQGGIWQYSQSDKDNELTELEKNILSEMKKSIFLRILIYRIVILLFICSMIIYLLWR